jgi:hypothetical protein
MGKLNLSITDGKQKKFPAAGYDRFGQQNMKNPECQNRLLQPAQRTDKIAGTVFT